MKKKYKLSNGKEIPSLGFGTFRLKEEVEDILKKALKVGYRLIDTAASYQNEEYVGKALRAVEINREDLFITVNFGMILEILKR